MLLLNNGFVFGEYAGYVIGIVFVVDVGVDNIVVVVVVVAGVGGCGCYIVVVCLIFVVVFIVLVVLLFRCSYGC